MYLEQKRIIGNLNNTILNCNKCKSLTKTRNRIVCGYGDFHAKLLLVGEAPGRFGADITGVPFTRDKSGILLQKMLRLVGMNLDNIESDNPELKDVYITNIVRCNPRGIQGTNRSPNNEEISNCNYFLEKEIEILDPVLIVPLGIKASLSTIGKKFSGKDFGKLVCKNDRNFFPLWHPAYVIRGGGNERLTVKKYEKYFQMMKEIYLGIKKNTPN